MTGYAGAVLRSARGARRMTQWEVCRAAGISQTRLSVLENGKKPVRPAEADRLAPVLGLAAAVLVRPPAPPRRPARTVAPAAVRVRTFTDIPACCPCDWQMTFTARKPSGWTLAKVAPGCPGHWGGAR